MGVIEDSVIVKSLGVILEEASRMPGVRGAALRSLVAAGGCHCVDGHASSAPLRLAIASTLSEMRVARGSQLSPSVAL